MAQNGPKGQHNPQALESRHREKLQQELNLSDEQTARLEELNKANKEAILSIRNDETLDRQTKVEMIREVRQEREEALKELFTPEQFKQYTQLQQQHKQHRKAQQPKGRREIKGSAS